MRILFTGFLLIFVIGATAQTIPGARLEIIDGMGHAIPESLWSVLSGHILRHVN